MADGCCRVRGTRSEPHLRLSGQSPDTQGCCLRSHCAGWRLRKPRRPETAPPFPECDPTGFAVWRCSRWGSRPSSANSRPDCDTPARAWDQPCRCSDTQSPSQTETSPGFWPSNPRPCAKLSATRPFAAWIGRRQPSRRPPLNFRPLSRPTHEIIGAVKSPRSRAYMLSHSGREFFEGLQHPVHLLEGIEEMGRDADGGAAAGDVGIVFLAQVFMDPLSRHTFESEIGGA